MPCYHPIDAYRTGTGHVVFSELARFDIRSRVSLPCGQCLGCRLDRSREWALRMYHEKQLHRSSTFLTLTYSDEHLPPGGSLRYSDVQKFLKRLRKALHPRKLRYVLCGEYGDRTGRAHYHIVLYGFEATDIQWSGHRVETGKSYYHSPFLAELWGLGGVFTGDVTPESCAYVARYITKKVTGDAGVAHYRYTDPDTGEVFDRDPPFLRCSLRPGIGADWYRLHPSEYHDLDFAVFKGCRAKVPRYYDKVLKRGDFDRLEELKESREKRASVYVSEQSPERLSARETVHRAKARFLKRAI